MKYSAIAGFLLPGIVHEYKNISSRINLLADLGLHIIEGPQATGIDHREIYRQIKDEAYSPSMSYISGLTNRLREKQGEAYDQSAATHIPADVETMLRILRSSFRSAGVTLSVRDFPQIHVAGDSIRVGINLARFLIRNFDSGVAAKRVVVSGESSPDALHVILHVNSVEIDRFRLARA